VVGGLGRVLGKVVWIALAAMALWFSFMGAVFLVMTTGWFVDLLSGRGPDGPEEFANALGLALVALLMSVCAFATISLPGFWFVAYTVRAFWRNETDWIRRYD
jgi:hypothetical protein